MSDVDRQAAAVVYALRVRTAELEQQVERLRTVARHALGAYDALAAVGAAEHPRGIDDMLTIPLRLNPQEYLLFIALQDANIERIKQYDPAEIVPWKFGGEWKNLRLREIHITYATEEDEALVHKLCQEGKVKEALQHLCRGFKYKPTMGDHDGQYYSVLNPGKPQ